LAFASACGYYRQAAPVVRRLRADDTQNDTRDWAYNQSMSSEVSRSYRYIVRSPDVRSGHARVEDTRIAVHDVIGLLQNGETVDSVTASCLPALTKSQVYECLAYYEDHRGEIDLLVARQMSDAHEPR
jgi:uncharacterized protein (DUF433 family)